MNEWLEEVNAVFRRNLEKGGVRGGNLLGQLESSESYLFRWTGTDALQKSS